MSTKWENYPWFAIIGALALLSLFMFCTAHYNFGSLLIPIYFTEGLLFITLGYLFYKGHTKQSWIVFLMALLWFLSQAITWGAWNQTYLSMILWLLFLAQAGLTYIFFTGKELKILNPTSPTHPTWGYAALFIIMFYAVGKLALNILYATSIMQMFTWSLAVLLTSLGYLFPKHEYSGYMKIFGVLIAAFSALTIGTSGLTLLSL